MGGKGSGFLGVGGSSGVLGAGSSSGFLGTGILSSGPQKITGFGMSPQAIQAEQAMLARQNAIASGQAPSYSQMAFNANLDQSNQQAMALAASQRGASNPMLAFRQAQIGNQQANLDGAQQGAIMAEQEKRQADQLIAAQAAAQRGVAFDQDKANQGATLANQKTQADFWSSLGGNAMLASKGKGGNA